MQVLFRLAYALVVGILISLFVVLGTHSLYDEPDFPNSGPQSPGNYVYCDDDDCYRDGIVITEDTPNLSDRDRQALAYLDDRRDYFRNVFIIAHLIGVASVAAGLYLYRRVDALPLGLLLGGLGAIIYGWVQAARGPETMGATVLFVVVTIGLVIVLAGGYWFLGVRERGPPSSSESA